MEGAPRLDALLRDRVPARSLGFHAVRITGHMRDLGVVDHGSVTVTFRDDAAAGTVLIDSSMLTNDPLPLRGDRQAWWELASPARKEPRTLVADRCGKLDRQFSYR